MGLFEKAVENKEVAEICKNKRKYNVGVSRAYYAVFQMAKHIMQKDHFDYEGFLSRKNPERTTYAYSHSTMCSALKWYLVHQKKINKSDLDELAAWGGLYERRLKADYEDSEIGIDCMEKSIRELNQVWAVLGAYGKRD